MSVDDHKFQSKNLGDRAILASAIIAKLHECGFKEVVTTRDSGDNILSHFVTEEKIFARTIKPHMEVRVYTTIIDHPRVGAAVRSIGTDAIRVRVIYKTTMGDIRGIGKQRRVNRTGKISAITDRMHQRLRDAWSLGRTAKCCGNCGAPMFTSKKGNEVCAEICRNPGLNAAVRSSY